MSQSVRPCGLFRPCLVLNAGSDNLGYFYDPVEKEVKEQFLPWLNGLVKHPLHCPAGLVAVSLMKLAASVLQVDNSLTKAQSTQDLIDETFRGGSLAKHQDAVAKAHDRVRPCFAASGCSSIFRPHSVLFVLVCCVCAVDRQGVLSDGRARWHLGPGA